MEKNICKGFKAAGVVSGLKKKKAKDLGLIWSEVPANAAGVFTRNLVQAAPVILDRERLKSGRCQAVIVNSGNANCCTGKQGMEDAAAMIRFAAAALNIPESLVCAASTGVIGQPMPIHKIETAMPDLAASLSSEGLDDFARAIMTTDLVPKVLTLKGETGGRTFSITAAAKGSGMIRPDMATMLCFVCTDLEVPVDILQKTLVNSTNFSFNRITVDGDTSTNDTVLIMANGMSGAVIKTEQDRALFQAMLDEILMGMAKMMVKDGEGATKLVEIEVKGALSDNDARAVADTIAHSSLVKTALFGEDANWGRIVAAAGRAGVYADPEKIDIYFNNIMMCKNSMTCGDKAEAEAAKVLKTPEFTITIDLNSGKGKASVFTCDFSIDYVKINADYRS
ncbi:Arginine biosynthesis bifunctional protein [Desulfonema limicola]|uniref:Arginine biosynthesis bifunctional protein ArgJ n=1 Tax=Desulfonema limicola TaxID=45656 RepID=A0A975BBV3_9BACT|nr:bifunctional glutamate N-acetyltransferase/amino-acid acetyltransferase ArgJ [Desulfonema limicola]QTA82390.1 Arginine biosynthesis bifunctional protein [Desulfonema limicola]